jgi:pimeloyl-ACP methyl ester carboxylesterase
VVLISSSKEPADWEHFALRLAEDHRVVALAGSAAKDLLAALRAIGGQPVLVAHSEAGIQASAVAASNPDALSGLVLADCCPSATTERIRVACPVLVLRGRQSTALSHSEAVALHEAVPGSRLVEPEDCGAWPFGSCPEASATAIRWFVSELASPFMEFVLPGDGEPVDPRALR